MEMEKLSPANHCIAPLSLTFYFSGSGNELFVEFKICLGRAVP
jgi:hypothetical protein